MGHLGQHRGALPQGNAQGLGRCQHIQGVVDHKAPGDVHLDGHPLHCRHGVKGDAIGREHDVLRPQVRRRLFAVGPHLAGRILQQPGRPGIVGIHHAGAAVLEQNGLSVAVILHGLMEIQVILGQVGEDAHVVVHAVDPVQIQRVGGGLHHHMGAAPVRHFPEQLLDLEGLRGGALRGDDLLADHILVGADKAHLGPFGLLQNGLQQIGGGGLAAGAGNGDHGHFLRRMAEPVGADHRQGPAGIRRLDISAVRRRKLLAQHRRRALFQGCSNILVAVGGKAGHGHEQVAGLGGPGVIADAGDFRFQVRRAGLNRDAGQQFSQFHNQFLPCSISVFLLYFSRFCRKTYRKWCCKTGKRCGNTLGVSLWSLRRTAPSPRCPPPALSPAPRSGKWR